MLASAKFWKDYRIGTLAHVCACHRPSARTLQHATVLIRNIYLNFDCSTVKHALQNTQNDCHQWLSHSFRGVMLNYAGEYCDAGDA